MPHASLRRIAPLYQVVKQHVLECIDSGRWKPGDRVASEHELVASLGVSRMTVNRAMRELALEGRLVRVAGVGSFVAPPGTRAHPLELRNIADDIRTRGGQHVSQVIELAETSVPVAVARLFDLVPGRRMFHSLVVHADTGVADPARGALRRTHRRARLSRRRFHSHDAERLPDGGVSDPGSRARRRGRDAERTRAATPEDGHRGTLSRAAQMGVDGRNVGLDRTAAPPGITLQAGWALRSDFERASAAPGSNRERFNDMTVSTRPSRAAGARRVSAPRGPELTARSWQTEAPLRMLMNNLDPEVAERPDDLVVYGGIGRAARTWECYDRLVETLPHAGRR